MKLWILLFVGIASIPLLLFLSASHSYLGWVWLSLLSVSAVVLLPSWIGWFAYKRANYIWNSVTSKIALFISSILSPCSSVLSLHLSTIALRGWIYVSIFFGKSKEDLEFKEKGKADFQERIFSILNSHYIQWLNLFFLVSLLLLVFNFYIFYKYSNEYSTFAVGLLFLMLWFFLAITNVQFQKYLEEQGFGFGKFVFKPKAYTLPFMFPLPLSVLCFLGMLVSCSMLHRSFSMFFPSLYSKNAAGYTWEWIIFSASYLEYTNNLLSFVESFPKGTSAIPKVLVFVFSVASSFYVIKFIQKYLENKNRVIEAFNALREISEKIENITDEIEKDQNNKSPELLDKLNLLLKQEEDLLRWIQTKIFEIRSHRKMLSEMTLESSSIRFKENVVLLLEEKNPLFQAKEEWTAFHKDGDVAHFYVVFNSLKDYYEEIVGKTSVSSPGLHDGREDTHAELQKRAEQTLSRFRRIVPMQLIKMDRIESFIKFCNLSYFQERKQDLDDFFRSLISAKVEPTSVPWRHFTIYVEQRYKDLQEGSLQSFPEKQGVFFEINELFTNLANYRIKEFMQYVSKQEPDAQKFDIKQLIAEYKNLIDKNQIDIKEKTKKDPELQKLLLQFLKDNLIKVTRLRGSTDVVIVVKDKVFSLKEDCLEIHYFKRKHRSLDERKEEIKRILGKENTLNYKEDTPKVTDILKKIIENHIEDKETKEDDGSEVAQEIETIETLQEPPIL